MASKTELSEEVRVSEARDLPVSIRVNGELHETSVPQDMLLVDFLRDRLSLTGTKYGCDTGHCGACVVLVNGSSVKSCAMLAAQADGCEITTIEGVSQGGVLNAVQTAFSEKHAVQCGYCTPGMVLSVTELLSRNPHPSEPEIRNWIDGNICRCGVYQNVVRAIHSLTAQAG
jgi:carbon-monoxide dehydrogenase small subunit